MKSIAYLALGSNIGDRELNLLRAVAEIGKIPDVRITGLSGFYDTDPVSTVPQDPFINAVLCCEVSMGPHQLLDELQRIESGVFRRKRNIPQGPRTMDLDILLFDDLVISDDRLTIPHPRLHQRRFVLVPLTEIAPDLVHPLIRNSVKEILDSLPDGERVVRV
ncbi:MAG: 2-amino-4-hydroxy-6-hydroxymethyldihydropteridine diphosphokinase [Geobacteraceae bacterium]|nr:2-amino-4-hydroxy-6-hydroxymethyldihydropteridine diphosphokinase [Geobacteraceae bacterium]